jgi:hypothetical protein
MYLSIINQYSNTTPATDPLQSHIFKLIDSTALDAVFAGGTTSVNCIQIDVQGSEGNALEGMTGLLQRCRE